MEASKPGLGLRAVEVRSGAPDALDRTSLRHSLGGVALLQRLWDAASTVESLHRRARDLRLAPVERPAAADLRRWPAAARFRQCPRCRPRLPPRPGAAS